MSKVPFKLITEDYKRVVVPFHDIEASFSLFLTKVTTIVNFDTHPEYKSYFLIKN